MLAQFICDSEPQGRLQHVLYSDAYRAAIQQVSADLSGAMRLRLSCDVVAMAIQCSTEGPERFLAALRMTRLPYPRTWIEIDAGHLENAYAMVRQAPAETPPKGASLGFLCEETDDGITIRQIHRTGTVKTEIDDDIVDVSYVRHLLKIGPWWDETYCRRDPSTITSEEAAKAASADIRLYFDDPDVSMHDVARRLEYAHRVSIIQSQTEKWLCQDSLRRFGAEYTIDTVNNHRRVHSHNIRDIVLPALILLCCKNATRQRAVNYEAIIQKKRARAGKAPLLDFSEVVSRLVPKSARAAGGTQEARAAMVMGHYKVRETGIFWWSPHARRGRGTASMSKLLKP